MRNGADTSCTENQHTHFIFQQPFFRKWCRLHGNAEKFGRDRQATDHNTIRLMCFACWITKATDTHSEHVNTYFVRLNVPQN
jgi:hypothetical protein